MLLGHESGQRAVDELLQGARAGRSGVLKTLSSVGIEAEHELPFADLHQLLRPCLGLLDRLPPPQALLGAALEHLEQLDPSPPPPTKQLAQLEIEPALAGEL